ncbi:type II toxin-antitoxin system VapC family toxin [Sphingomonas sp. QA11]|uniref:type II toxin-antitoxin system VapC family toxin n=1 Tax=Sphingomonas sp. QA11 TaxID=2950605 RepID=UPI00234B16F6|nr:type II toxin-antitoxin system VapC family toxin [Sphingomonas sp. QA11]WCM26054.1 type II toxin-antitoxin system VapC family toxin [Sphingomonas sp. QA11]
MRQVLDASALLAVLLDEPGGDRVLPALQEAVMSAVNLSESVSRAIDRGFAALDALALVDRFRLTVSAFDRRQAELAAGLRLATRPRGLSLGDRACLALALDLDCPVLTADRAWAELDLGVDIRLIR